MNSIKSSRYDAPGLTSAFFFRPLAKPSLREIIETENQPTDPLSKTAKVKVPGHISFKLN